MSLCVYYLFAFQSTGVFQDLNCNWTKAISDTAHAQSFDVACTRDRFSLFSFLVAGTWKTSVAIPGP
jgi:hypothetical protein